MPLNRQKFVRGPHFLRERGFGDGIGRAGSLSSAGCKGSGNGDGVVAVAERSARDGTGEIVDVGPVEALRADHFGAGVVG